MEALNSKLEAPDSALQKMHKRKAAKAVATQTRNLKGAPKRKRQRKRRNG